VSINVYDLKGSMVSELVKGNYSSGSYEVIFDASKLTSGIYFYKIQSGDFTSVRKMMLIK
jgi:hypothetical protein